MVRLRACKDRDRMVAVLYASAAKVRVIDAAIALRQVLSEQHAFRDGRRSNKTITQWGKIRRNVRGS